MALISPLPQPFSYIYHHPPAFGCFPFPSSSPPQARPVVPSSRRPPVHMSHRHVPRQSDRDVRMHEPSHPHPHALITHPPHPAPAHPPHLNGNSATLPSTPATLSNGSNHAHPPANQIVSPVVVPNAPPPNGAPASSSVIHKLAVANEQTWLLIGASNFFFSESTA